MALPTIRKPTVAPSRKMARDVYPIVADEWAASIGPFTDDLIVAISWMGQQVTDVADYKDQAAASAKAAAKSVEDAAAQVKLATDQAQASKGWADSAKGYRDSAQVSAQAAQAAAGLPASKMPGAVLRQMLDGSSGVEWWNLVVTQVGDTIVSTQAPDAGWVPTGRTYSQSLYPLLASKLGAVADWPASGVTVPGSQGSVNVTCVAYGGGLTVSMYGQYNSVSSDYFNSWAQYNSPANYSWSDIDYGFGLFMLVAANAGSVFYSANGYGNWNQGTGTPSGGTETRLRMGSNVALWLQGASTAYATSGDGKNWTSRTLPFTPARYVRPAFGKGMFVMLSSTGVIWSSPDAINWTNRGTAPGIVGIGSSSVRMEASDTGILMLDVNGNCAFSPDGINWAAGAKAIFPASGVPNLSGGQGGFIVQSVNSTIYLTTVDGSKWTSRNLPATTLAGFSVYIPTIKTHLIMASPTNSSIIRIKPFSYDPAVQFYTTDPAVTSQGLTQFIRGV